MTPSENQQSAALAGYSDSAAAKKYDRSKVEEGDRRIVDAMLKHTRPVESAAQRRRVLRDVVRGELRKGNLRLALAILLWPPGWSHTRLEDK